MGWIFTGFIMAIFIESIIRITSDYSPEETHKRVKRHSRIRGRR